jgi:hypothetical protein
MSQTPSKARQAALAIVSGGVIAGVLDIIFAFVFYGQKGLTPVQILQSVASGLLGKAAFDGGATAAALGALCQLIIPALAAAVYFGFSEAMPALRRHAVAAGLLFGAVVYAVMNLVVVPLSAAPFKPKFPLASLLPALAAHMVFVGLPIALANRKYLGPATAA